MVLEGLIGSLLGGVFRIVPEVINVFDRKNERTHELKMLGAEMEFAKINGEIHMKQVEASMTVAELDAMSVAVREQGQTARKAGKFVAGISALVRPLVTYWFVGLYSLMKIATMVRAIDYGAEWKGVIITAWGAEDTALLGMILTFWFVGRVWDRHRRASV
jgi:hypothetical protein